MEAIDIMVEEHANIRRMLKVIKELSYRVLTLGDFDLEDITKIIDFIRTYADKHHHGKEEDILFKTMNKEIQKLAESGAITGMYIEHDSGRLYVSKLEKAVEAYREGDDRARLDIIANAICYADLLDRHIEKENTAMYRFAENMLKEDSKSYIEEECERIEAKASEQGLQEKYLSLLEDLEKKYLNP